MKKMFSKISRAMVGPVVLFLLVVMPAIVLTAPALAQPPDLQQGLCDGASFSVASGSGNCDTNVNQDSFQTTVTNIVNIITFIVGAVAVVMIIYGGFRYITSGGDPGKVTSAKNTILYGLIGLVIVAVAQVLTRFVFTQVNTNFS